MAPLCHLNPCPMQRNELIRSMSVLGNPKPQFHLPWQKKTPVPLKLYTNNKFSKIKPTWQARRVLFFCRQKSEDFSFHTPSGQNIWATQRQTNKEVGEDAPSVPEAEFQQEGSRKSSEGRSHCWKHQRAESTFFSVPFLQCTSTIYPSEWIFSSYQDAVNCTSNSNEHMICKADKVSLTLGSSRSLKQYKHNLQG